MRFMKYFGCIQFTFATAISISCVSSIHYSAAGFFWKLWENMKKFWFTASFPNFEKEKVRYACGNCLKSIRNFEFKNFIPTRLHRHLYKSMANVKNSLISNEKIRIIHHHYTWQDIVQFYSISFHFRLKYCNSWSSMT